MSDQGYRPQEPPHVAPPAHQQSPYPGWAPQPSVPQSRRSRTRVWWTLAVVFGLGLLVTCCLVPLALIGTMDSATPVASGDAVAVIHLDGIIAGTGDSYSGYSTPEDIWDLLERAREDKRVKAVLLRVDSPGGTVAASEEIASFIADYEKPVIVSSGDVNASGAYMVSSQADEIWAQPGTAVGSIGVIAQIPNVAGLMDRIGVEFSTFKAGKNKDTGSPYRPLTKEERALIQGEVDEAYRQFIDIVAEGRGMKRSDVESLATGWAWSGEQAKKLGLVDRLGSYDEALDAAAKAGGIEGDYDVVEYEDVWGDLLGSLLGISGSLQRLAALAGPEEGSAVRQRLIR